MNRHLVSKELASIIVESIEDATGDYMKEDLSHNDLRFFNSIPHRTWDHIFSLLEKRANEKGFIVFRSNSGPWKFPLIYDPGTGNIVSLMREKRYLQLKRQQLKRRRSHYVDILATVLNKRLQPQFDQLCILDNCNINLDEFRQRATFLLEGLGKQADLIHNHVLILFESSNFQLLTVHAVMVTPKLEIAVNGKEDLSYLISSNPSIIIDETSDLETLVDSLPFNLKLSAKAIARQKGCVNTISITKEREQSGQ